jgi:hypothetical protein
MYRVFSVNCKKVTKKTPDAFPFFFFLLLFSAWAKSKKTPIRLAMGAETIFEIVPVCSMSGPSSSSPSNKKKRERSDGKVASSSNSNKASSSRKRDKNPMKEIEDLFVRVVTEMGGEECNMSDVDERPSLDAEQEIFVRLVVRNIMSPPSPQQKSSKMHHSVFLTGVPGSGKTWIVKRVRYSLVDHTVQKLLSAGCSDRTIALDVAKTYYPIVTPTAAAASLIGGGARTFQSFIGSLGDSPIDACRISDRIRSQIANAVCIFYDEVSMMHPRHFRNANQLFKDVRNNGDFFGGVTMVMSGDFYQLLPVIMDDDKDAKRLGGKDKMPLLFELPEWRANVEVVELTKPRRQSGDGEFAALLNSIRSGELSQREVLRLKSRVMPVDNFRRYLRSIDVGRHPQSLYVPQVCFKNADVDKENDRQMQSIEEPIMPFKAQLVYSNVEWNDLSKISTKGEWWSTFNSSTFQSKAHYGETFTAWADTAFSLPSNDALQKATKSRMSTPLMLSLKKGAVVVYTTNHSFKRGLFNGARGIVVGFSTEEEWSAANKYNSTELLEDMTRDDETSSQKLDAEDELVVQMESFGDAPISAATGSASPGDAFRHTRWPVVCLDSNGEARLIKPQLVQFDMTFGGYYSLYAWAIPLRLAWASTVHAQQGQTMGCAYIVTGEYAQAGQFYVAISRVTDISMVAIDKWSSSFTWVDERVKRYYAEIRAHKESSSASLMLFAPPLGKH